MSHIETRGKKFVFPEGLKYKCIMCGKCCTDFWEIPVDESSMERIKSLDLSPLEDRLAHGEPFEESKIEGGKYIIQQPYGRCLFLGHDQRCLLHANYGYESKPGNCKVYPFQFAVTPVGIYVGVAFSCQSVLENHGEPISEYELSLGKEAGRGVRIYQLEPEVRLTDEICLSWPDYLKIEEGLVKLLDSEAYSLGERLVAGKIYLDMLVNFIKEAQSQGSYDRGYIIDKFIKGVEERLSGRLFSMARQPLYSPFLQRMFLGMIISFRNTIFKRRGRLATLTYLFFQYARHILRLGRVKLLPLELDFFYSDFRAIRIDLDEPYFEHQIRRYIKHLIFRKDLIRSTDLLTGYGFMLMHYALIKWYLVGLVASRAANEPQRDDILEAIRLVEKYYVLHSSFDVLFTRYPVLGDTVANFFQKKRYAPTMVGSPVKQ